MNIAHGNASIVAKIANSACNRTGSAELGTLNECESAIVSTTPKIRQSASEASGG